MVTRGEVEPKGVHSRPVMSPAACERLGVMLREFHAQLLKGENPRAWTCGVMADAAELLGTPGLVKIRGATNGQPIDGALMAQGDGTHRLPSRRSSARRSAKRASTPFHVRVDERIG